MFNAAPFMQAGNSDVVLQEMAARNPTGRLGVPDDIAAAAAFLCSQDAGYSNGQTIGVNGGSYI